MGKDQVSPHSTVRRGDDATSGKHAEHHAEKPDAISDDRLYKGNEHYNEVIIHRSANCIIVAG